MPDDDVRLSSHQVAKLARVTYRQLDEWVRLDLVVIADRSPGSGSSRRWSAAEARKARALAALVHAGVTPRIAATALQDGDALIGEHRLSVQLGGLTVTGELP